MVYSWRKAPFQHSVNEKESFICKDVKIIKGRVLKDGEVYRKSDGLYMYRWTAKNGKTPYHL